MNLSPSISQRGYVAFCLHTDRTWQNGAAAPILDQTLVRLPGLATCRLTCGPAAVNLIFEWVAGQYDRGFLVDLPQLPGPRSYFVAFTWDAARGLCDGYLNGIPLRLPGTRLAPWNITGCAKRCFAGRGTQRVTNIQATAQYLSPRQIEALVPPDLRQCGAGPPGDVHSVRPIAIRSRIGRLLYAKPLNKADDITEWVREGPAKCTFPGRTLRMQQASEDPQKGPGHFVLWCPHRFPNRFVARWQFRPVSRHGLAIVFFAARGADGGDIFDAALPPRNGIFDQYTKGGIVSYHISYFAHLPKFQTGRPTSSLRKNNRFYLVALGPIAVKPKTAQFKNIWLIKDGRHIQFIVDGKVIIDWNDDAPDRYGAAYTGGHIGLRQMAGTIGEYRNFSVWQLYARRNPAKIIA